MQTLYNMASSVVNRIYSSDPITLGDKAEDMLSNVVDPGILLCKAFPLYQKEIQQVIVNYLNGEGSGFYFDRLNNTHPQFKLFDWIESCDATVKVVHSDGQKLNNKEKDILLSKFVGNIDEVIPKTIFNHELIPVAHKGSHGEMLDAQHNKPLSGKAVGYDSLSTYLYDEGFPIGEIREEKLFNRRGDLANGEAVSFDGECKHLYHEGSPVGYFKGGLLVDLKSGLLFSGKAPNDNNSYTCLYQNGVQIGRFGEINCMTDEKESILFDNKGAIFSGEAPNVEGNGIDNYKNGVKVNEILLNSQYELQYTASTEEIKKLRENMALFLKNEMQKNGMIVFYFNDAIQGKFESIPEDDLFWTNIQNKRSSFDFRIKTEIFQNEPKSSVMKYLVGESVYTEQQQSTLVDIFIKTDAVHPYLAFAELFCINNNIDFSKIDYADNHFFIKGKSKLFIPNDGNCFFHCLNYLSKN